MMMKQKRSIVLVYALIFSALACEDPRPTQRENNIFDPDHSFVRFNYDNTVNTPAKDSVFLSRLELDTIEVPVALSAPPQEPEVIISLALTTEGDIAEGIHFELLGEIGEPLNDGRIVLPPGAFDFFITYFEKDTLPPGRHRVILEIESVSPDFHLGFPGSGRGSRFDLINE